MATLLTTIGSEVALVPWSITHLQFPGVKYLPFKQRAAAFMDLHDVRWCECQTSDA